MAPLFRPAALSASLSALTFTGCSKQESNDAENSKWYSRSMGVLGSLLLMFFVK